MDANNRIALVMIVKNEEAKLARCLDSAAPYIDEIIIVDTGSNDKTKIVAESYGARVYDYEWDNHFGHARNYALDKSTANWNLILDADEWITEINMVQLRRFMLEGDKLGRIQILNEIESDGERQVHRGYITRFISANTRFTGRIHEQADSSKQRVHVPITVQHDGYLNVNKSERNIPMLLAEIKFAPNDSYTNYQLGKEYEGINELEKASTYYRQAYFHLQGHERYAPNVVVQYLYVLKDAKQFADALDIIRENHSWVEHFPDYHFVRGLLYLDVILSNPEAYLALLPEIETAYKRCLAIGETDQYDSQAGVGSFIALYNLGVYYEIFGKTQEAINCYQQSSVLGYSKAKERMRKLQF